MMDDVLYTTAVPSSQHSAHAHVAAHEAPHSPSHPLSPPSPTRRISQSRCSTAALPTSSPLSSSLPSLQHPPHDPLLSPSHTPSFFSALASPPVSASPVSPTASSSPSSRSSVSSSSPSPPLARFPHQVAGHSPLLSHAGTICKPLIPQELHFYSQLQSALPCMVPFVPKFYGVLDPKQLDESAKRELGLSGLSDERASTKGEYCEQTAALLASSTCLTNPWSSSIHQQRPPSSTSPTYLVIEDLTYAYTLPCIIDLKLGKRQHGLHDSEEKIKSKQRKCALTTSKRLGVRLCGMQRYDVKAAQWDTRDKYEGRKLTEDGFIDTLKDFFHNGQELRLAVMSAVLARLVLMRATLQQVKAWKFYSSSLLIVYEGSMEGSERIEGKSTIGGVEYTIVSPPASPSLSPSLASSAEAALSPLLTSLSAYSPTFLSQTLSSVNSHYRSSSSFALSCSLASLQQAVPTSFTLPSASTLATSASCSAINHTPRSSKQLFMPHTPTAAAASSNSTAATVNITATTAASPLNCCYTYPSSVSSSQSSPLLTKLYTKRRKTTYTQAKERRIERGNVDVRLIDFAHTARVDDQCSEHMQQAGPAAAGAEEEEGLLFGFDTLIAAIARMMDEELVRRNTTVVTEVQTQQRSSV